MAGAEFQLGAGEYVSVSLERDAVVVVPDPDYFGLASFQYALVHEGDVSWATVTLRVTAIDDPPRVEGEQVLAPPKRELRWDVEWLLDNDFEPDGEPLSITSVGSDRGVVWLDEEVSQVVFQPPAITRGRARIRYTVSDGRSERTAYLVVHLFEGPTLGTPIPVNR